MQIVACFTQLRRGFMCIRAMGEKNIELQATYRRGGVELFGKGDKGDAVSVENLNHLVKSLSDLVSLSTL